MPVSPLAGKPAPAEVLIDVDRLVAAYHDRRPDPSNPRELVSFGTSGHRGAPEDGAFNEAHILAITQAICEHRSAPRDHRAALPRRRHPRRVGRRRCGRRWRCSAANGVETRVSREGDYTPTPALSRAILSYNDGRDATRLADGIVITPSHNPPARRRLQVQPAPRRPGRHRRHRRHPGARQRAAARGRRRAIRRVAYAEARRAPTTREHDFLVGVRRGSAGRRRRRGDRARQGEARRRSDGRRQRAVLVAHRRALRPRPRRRQHDRRPALRVHAARSRRQDPDGLLQPLRDGEPARGSRIATPSRSATTPTPIATASSPRPGS